MSSTIVASPTRNVAYRRLKKVGWICVALVLSALLVILAMVWGLTHLDAGATESLINHFLLDSKQRTLKMERAPRLSVWPMLEVQLGPCTLSERNSTTPFARIETMEWTMPWAPLFEKQVVIPSLHIEGLFVTITRDRAGKLNMADLFEPSADPDTGWRFRIDHLSLAQGNLRWRDDMATSLRVVDMDRLQLKVEHDNQDSAEQQSTLKGRLVLSGHGYSPTTPALDANLTLTSNYTLDKSGQHYAAQNTQVNIDGQYEKMLGHILLNIQDARLMSQTAVFQQMTLSLKSPSHYGSLAVPRLEVSSRAVQADSLQLDASNTFENGVQTKVKITTPLTLSFENHMLSFNLNALETQLNIVAPQYLAHPLSLVGSGSVQAEIAQDSSLKMAAQLQGQVDQSPYSLHLKLARAAQFRVETALDIERLNLDSLLKPSAASVSKTGQNSKPKFTWAVSPDLDFEGKLHAGTLTFSGIQMHQLHLVAASKDGRLKIQTQ